MSFEEIHEAIIRFRAERNRWPRTLLCSLEELVDLRRDPEVLARIKYTSESHQVLASIPMVTAMIAPPDTPEFRIDVLPEGAFCERFTLVAAP